jgi:PAS domain S-box-containing protein
MPSRRKTSDCSDNERGSLHELESLLRAFDSFPLALSAVDGTGRCHYSNHSFSTISGLPNFNGHNIRELFPGKNEKQILEEQLRLRFENSASTEYDNVATRLVDGRKLPVRVSAMPLHGAVGQVIGAIAIFRDLTADSVVQEINRSLTVCRTAKDLLTTTAKQIFALIPFDYLHATIYSADFEHLRSFFTYPEPNSSYKVRWLAMLPKLVSFASDQSVRRFPNMDLYFEDPNFLHKNERLVQSQGWLERPKSLLRYPLVWEGSVVASLSLGRKEKDAFSQEEENFIRILPIREVLSMALYFEKINYLEFRLDLMRGILDSWDSQEKVADVIVAHLLEYHDWDHVAFFHVDERTQKIRLLNQRAKEGFLLPAEYEQTLDLGIMGFVYRFQKMVCIDDLDSDPVFKEKAIRGFKSPTLSELCLPIILGNRVCWMLNIEDSRENAFSRDEISALQTIVDELTNLLDGVLSRHFVDATVTSSSDAIIFIDGAGVITRINAAAERLLGYSRDALVEKHLEIVLNRRSLLDGIIAGQRISYEQVSLQHAIGKEIRVLLSAWPLPKALGGSVVLARDLTMIERLQELEYLSQVYREVAIQTKTPLSLALTWLGSLPKTKTAEKIDQELSKIQLTFDRLALFGREASDLPFRSMILTPSQVIDVTLENFPRNERRKIRTRRNRVRTRFRGDLYQLAFCLRTVVSYLLRFAPERQAIQLNVRHRATCVVFEVCGMLPTDTSDSDALISQALADIALGEDLLTSIARRHEGSYSGPDWKEGMAWFYITVPEYLGRS